MRIAGIALRSACAGASTGFGVGEGRAGNCTSCDGCLAGNGISWLLAGVALRSVCAGATGFPRCGAEERIDGLFEAVEPETECGEALPMTRFVISLSTSRLAFSCAYSGK